jgi:hypothetical protein
MALRPARSEEAWINAAGGLGLGHIDFAIVKSAFTKLAGLGQARSRYQQPLDYVIDNYSSAMAADFNRVLAGKGVGLTIWPENYFVDRAAIGSC